MSYFMIRTFLITFIFLMTKLYTTSLHLIFGLKRAIVLKPQLSGFPAPRNSALYTLHSTLHTFNHKLNAEHKSSQEVCFFTGELRSCKV